MAILGEHSVETFLTDHWQQKPLLIRNASHDFSQIISADELAGMACEEEVESRLISCNKANQWHLENGPIDENRFSELPEQDWTLLVQAADQWLPEVRSILSEFDFLPSWRLDDVMISYATPGGGVGPHFDYYDVFLLQTQGKKRWRLGQKCDQKTPLKPEQPLKLLEDFEQTEDHELEPGDMLYIPAGVAHWGTSLDDDCMTWSIGFRAPSAKDLLFGAMDRLSDQLPEHLRYQDSPESLNALPGEISASVSKQMSELKAVLSEEMLTETMSDILGERSTEPRYPDLIETLQEEESWTMEQVTSENLDFMPNEASRFAYRVDPKDKRFSQLYVNGSTMKATTELAQSICNHKFDSKTRGSQAGRELLLQLLNSGAYLGETADS